MCVHEPLQAKEDDEVEETLFQEPLGESTWQPELLSLMFTHTEYSIRALYAVKVLIRASLKHFTSRV